MKELAMDLWTDYVEPFKWIVFVALLIIAATVLIKIHPIDLQRNITQLIHPDPCGCMEL